MAQPRPRSDASTVPIVAALLLAAAVLGGSWMVAGALDRGTAELASVRAALVDVGDTLGRGIAAPSAARAARPRGPDPERRYSIATADAPVKGPEGAPVTIVEFSDFQCPFCQRVGPTLDQIQREYGDRVRIAFKHLPLVMHPKAPAAHAAAEAAHRQGQFWEMHDRIFANQAEMSPEKYVEYARELGLDVERFSRDVDSAEVRDKVESDKRMATSLGVSGTPAFFVNGRFLSGAKPFESFKELIDEELARRG